MPNRDATIFTINEKMRNKDGLLPCGGEREKKKACFFFLGSLVVSLRLLVSQSEDTLFSVRVRWHFASILFFCRWFV